MNYWTAKRMKNVKATNIPELIEKGIFRADELFIKHKSKTEMNTFTSTETMKLEFYSSIGEIQAIHPVTKETITVCPTEDINHDVVEEIVKQYNEGFSLTRIKNTFEQDERITGDEIDYLIEQLEIWDESKEAQVGAPVEEKVDDLPFELTNTEKQVLETNKEINDKDGKINEKVDSAVNIIKKERKKREPKTETTSVKGNKKLSPADYLQMLQEKMELTKYISSIVIPEIETETTMSKVGKDLLKDFDEELSKLLSDFIERIQKI